MAKYYNNDKKLISFAHKIFETTESLHDYKRALCVILSSDFSSFNYSNIKLEYIPYISRTLTKIRK
jgi:hypothetical protein